MTVDSAAAFSTEARFLVAAVRRFLDTAAPVPDCGPGDPAVLIKLAIDHAVAPMVYRAARALDSALAKRLRATCDKGALASLRLAAELCTLSDLLARNGIAFVPLKGPLLSQRLYGDVSVRTSGDLDLLVREEDLLAARDVAAGLGYEVAVALPWSDDRACLASRECELPMVNHDSSMALDLHWRALPGYFPNPFEAAPVWNSLISTRVAGRDLPDLCPEHLLLFLCVHGSKHAFERLGWIVDIASCLRTQRIDWQSIKDIAKRSGTARQLSLGLHLAGELLGAPQPSQLPADPIAKLLARSVIEHILTARPFPTPARELIPFCLKTLESTRDRARYLAGHLAPSAAEFQLLRLPPALQFLYYPLRALRLVSRVSRARPATDRPAR